MDNNRPLTVGELITLLKTFDPEKEVKTRTHRGTFDFIYGDSVREGRHPSTKNKVVIS